MNYYNPNYYMSNPYSQYTYASIPQQQQQNAMPPSMAMTQNNVSQSTPSAPVLNGKIVDGEDVVKATEVPIGGYGIFPKADLSEIYLKTWNNNGTTSIIKFKPDNSQVQQQQNIAANDYNELLEKINSIEGKLDNLLTQPKPVKKKYVQKQQQPQTKTEVTNNDF